MRIGARNRSTGITLRALVVLLSAALFGACSAVRLGYDNADTLLLYKLDGYFDLDLQQQQLARDRVRALLAWHRRTQLRGYSELIEAAGRSIETGIAPDDVLALNLEMNRRLITIGEQAAGDLAALALTLQPEQVEHFAAKLADDDEQARHELAPAGKRPEEARIKRAVARADEWFGSVSPQQVQLIRAAIAARPNSDAWWARERERRRGDLLELLRRVRAEHPPADEAARWLRQYFARLPDPLDAQRRARLMQVRRDNAELIAALVNAATPEQKATLLGKLRGYAEDFTTLASSGGRS